MTGKNLIEVEGRNITETLNQKSSGQGHMTLVPPSF